VSDCQGEQNWIELLEQIEHFTSVEQIERFTSEDRDHSEDAGGG
jgi:hypothetical protein